METRSANPGRITATRIAVVVSHPIQHFAPWFRTLSSLEGIEIKVMYACNWGAESYFDPGMNLDLQWDIPLTDGYQFEVGGRIAGSRRLTFWTVDFPELSDNLYSFSPDVVVVFGYAHRACWRAVAWARHAKVPLMLYSDSQVRKRDGARGRLHRVVVRAFYRYVDGALAVGPRNAAYHRSFGIPQERVFPGALPIDVERLRAAVPDIRTTRAEVRREHGIPESASCALFCGKIVERKRPFDFVRAISGATSLTDQGLWGIVVGDGPLRAALVRYCQENNIENVVFAGFVNQSKIARFYAASDFLVVPSQLDPHPLVISEAAVFGLPVVVSDSVGCAAPGDTADPDKNALLYAGGDVPELVQKLISLVGNHALYEKLSVGAKEVARGQSIGTTAIATLNACTELTRLGKRRSDRR